MKKLLLILTTLFALVASAQNPVVSITTEVANQRNKVGAYNTSWKLGASGSDQTWTVYAFNNNQNSTSWNDARCGWKTNASVATISTDFAISAAIDKVTIDVTRIKNGTNDKITSLKLLVSATADFAEATEYEADVTEIPTATNGKATLTINVTSAVANQYYRLSFDLPKAANNGWLSVKSISYYGQAEEGATAAPVISLAENNMVTISAEEGAAIYYTTNGEVPTTSSTQYSAPFEISDVTTVKAIAVLEGKESAVTTKEIKPNVVTSIGKFLELANNVDDTKINATLTAIYQCGRNLYLTDGTDYLLAYNGNNVAAVSNLAAENGDVISYISGAYKSQAGLPEIIPSAVGEKSTGTAVEPNEYAIEEISSSMLNEYVKISGLNIVAASSDNNYTATDETGSIVIYNTFNNATNYPEAITQPDGTKNNTVPEGEGFTVYGFVSCFNSTLQITPIKFEGGVVMEQAATPTFDPESGSELSVGDLISIDCATEGAKIYYTTNGDTPTAESTEYTAPIEFTEACTIKAIAVAEGYLDSDVATATYSLYVEGEKSYTFDFTTYGNVGSLANAELLAPSSSATTTPIDGVSFNYGPVQLSYYTANHSNKTSPAWFYYNSKAVTECRVYKANQFDVFLTQNGYKITKIEFTQNSGSTTWAASNVTTNLSEESTSMSGKTWEAPTSGLVNKVTFVPTGSIRFATMTVSIVEDSNGVMEIEGIGTDNSNAPVEYYNIQGIRVNEGNLTPGLYIRRQGTEATKVFINK